MTLWDEPERIHVQNMVQLQNVTETSGHRMRHNLQTHAEHKNCVSQAIAQ